MTMALCFNCGNTKFGALCPCPECSVATTGNMQLDILFSDHHYSWDTLKGFGDVIRSIREVCTDDQLRFWCFMHYIARNHPQILGVQIAAEHLKQCDEVLQKARPPAVVVEESELRSFQRRSEGESDPDAQPGDSEESG